MANLKLKTDVFQVVEDSVQNVENRYEGNDLNLPEDFEKKLFNITATGINENVYSLIEASDLLVELYTPTDEN